MFRSFAAATILVSCLTAAGWAQSPATSSTPAAATPAKPVTKKAAPKAKAAAKQPVAETGPCRLGVISALGDRFSVQKFGLTIFENEENDAPMNGWGLDDLPFARVRAATGADPSVRRIAYPAGAFEPYYNPKSRFLPDPSEGLPAIVRGITANANCERYLVITKYNGVVPGTKMEIKGIGAYSQGIGSFARHSICSPMLRSACMTARRMKKSTGPSPPLALRLRRGSGAREAPHTSPTGRCTP